MEPQLLSIFVLCSSHMCLFTGCSLSGGRSYSKLKDYISACVASYRASSHIKSHLYYVKGNEQNPPVDYMPAFVCLLRDYQLVLGV